MTGYLSNFRDRTGFAALLAAYSTWPKVCFCIKGHDQAGTSSASRGRIKLAHRLLDQTDGAEKRKKLIP